MKHVFTALVVGSALWLGSGVASAQAPKIKVGRTTGASGFHLPTYVAMDRGLVAVDTRTLRPRATGLGGVAIDDLGAAPDGIDVLLRTAALDRVVEHAPLDQIVTVECGVRLAPRAARPVAQARLVADRQRRARRDPRGPLPRQRVLAARHAPAVRRGPRPVRRRSRHAVA